MAKSHSEPQKSEEAKQTEPKTETPKTIKKFFSPDLGTTYEEESSE